MSVPPTASTPPTGELQRARSPGGWGALADWLARQVADGAGVHPAGSRVPRAGVMSPRSCAHRACIHALSGCQPTATLPLHYSIATALAVHPTVGNGSAACAAAGDVHLARIAPSREPEARHRKPLIGPPGASGESPCDNREPAQRYSTWKRGTRSSHRADRPASRGQ